MSAFPSLFQPVDLGPIRVKNRVVMAPMGTNLAEPEGGVTAGQIRHYQARARGGVGLIIVEDTTIGPRYIQNTTSLDDDRFIPGWRRLTEAVHAHGARIMPQLIHPSFNAPEALNQGAQPVAASPIPSRALRRIPRELTEEEIEKIIEQFARAARRAREAGCDGVQLHCAHVHHLLGSFLSPYYNKRTDRYGGSLEGRLRLPLEVIGRVREALGPNLALLIRVSGDEFLPGGRTLAESRYLAPLLVEAGVDAIHVSAGTTLTSWLTVPPTGSPQALHAPLAAAIRQSVRAPIVLVGRITEPWAAAAVIDRGQADLVCLGRALLADPEWADKAVQGAVEEITPCLGDSWCLVRVARQGKPVACLMNPFLGREDGPADQPTVRPKKVLVAGAGPAGLTAARIAAQRGHRVTVMEKGGKTGGQLQLAAFPPMKQEYAKAVRYLESQARRAGAALELNREVTPEVLESFGPEAVVVATGGAPSLPSGIPGLTGANVVTAWDVLAGRVFPGPKIAVIGGGMVGCETADYLAQVVDDASPGGNQVVVLEMLENVVLDNTSPWRSVLVTRLKSKGVKFILGARVTEILPDGLRYEQNGQGHALTGLDAVVVALGTRSVDPLSQILKDKSIPTYVIGDAQKPGNAAEAIAAGAEVGLRL
ncbi:MAG: FAD-dependent oxidoreductase [Thermodesulfobacteriota bacterium]